MYQYRVGDSGDYTELKGVYMGQEWPPAAEDAAGCLFDTGGSIERVSAGRLHPDTLSELRPQMRPCVPALGNLAPELAAELVGIMIKVGFPWQTVERNVFENVRITVPGYCLVEILQLLEYLAFRVPHYPLGVAELQRSNIGGAIWFNPDNVRDTAGVYVHLRDRTGYEALHGDTAWLFARWYWGRPFTSVVKKWDVGVKVQVKYGSDLATVERYDFVTRQQAELFREGLDEGAGWTQYQYDELEV